MKRLGIRRRAEYVGLFVLCFIKHVFTSDEGHGAIIGQYRLPLVQRIDLMVKTRHKDHPCLHVSTLDRLPVLSKSDYVPAVLDVFNCPLEQQRTITCEIRVRGHSTAEQGDNKPYRIHFDKDVSLLGLHGNIPFKSWVLLRTYNELVHDYLALKLFSAISEGKYYCSDCKFINLYLNQKYRGIYLLCEQNQAGRGRMEVYEPGRSEEQVEIGYLLELDHYAGEEHPYFTVSQKPQVTDIAGGRRILYPRDYSLKSKIRSKAQFDHIQAYLTGVFEILFQASVNNMAMTLDKQFNVIPIQDQSISAFEAVSEVIDLESLANILILDELVQNYDVGAGGMYMAIDFSDIGIYKRLTFLGPWDFNWAYCEDPDQDYYACTFQKIIENVDRSNGWFILSMRLDGFQDLVKEKWRKLKQNHVLETVLYQVKEECRSLRNDLGDQQYRLKGAARLTDYVSRRIAWLNRHWL